MLAEAWRLSRRGFAHGFILSTLLYWPAGEARAECRRPLLEPGYVASTALLVADWGQTRHIAANPDRFSEGGFARHFIGTRPNLGRVNTYFASWIAVNTAIQCWAPERFRNVFIWGMVGVQAHTVRHNINVGVRFKW